MEPIAEKAQHVEHDTLLSIGPGKDVVNLVDDQHLDAAEEWINKAIEADSNNGTLLNLGRTYALYAELHKRKGDRNNAIAVLNKAIEVFRDCGSDGFLKQAEKGLASIV